MNSKLYKQADSRWGSKPYPSGSTMSGCGCGCVACTHIVIEQEKYKDYTPENLRPWMISQGFAIRGQGTTWNGITKTLQHYGYKVTHIGVSDPMSKAWAELDKGNRIGIILFKSGKAPNGTVWTAGGHYVAFTDYKKQDGLHYFYTKDSGGRNHDSAKYGYYSYEKSMKGLVYQMWIVQRIGTEVKATSTTTTKTTTTASTGTLAVDGKFGPASIKALQKVLGTTQDGKISGQTSTLKKYHTGFSSGISYGKGGSACVKALQKMLKLSGPDGQLGPNTIKAFQKYLGMSGPDGYWGPNTSKAVQKWLNTKLNPTPTSTTPKSTTTTTTTTTPSSSSTSNSSVKSEEVIDVSYVQSKTIDWAKVKAAGIAGAIVRCGYRGYGSGSLNEDSMFLKHVQGAYKAGLKVGIYFFTEAINEAEGREEARFAIKMLQKSGVKLTYPIAVDTENINASNPTPRANSGKLSTANRTAAIKGFCDEIKKNGYEPMIYASTSWLNNQLNMSQLPYKVWVAQYNTKVTYSGSYIIWQYTSTAKVNGIDGVVDKNHSYYALGNVTPTTVASTPVSASVSTPVVLKSIDVVAQEVLDGKWGSGETRKQKLTAAGYNYDTVQKKVNELLASKKTIDELAQEVLQGKWGSGEQRKTNLVAAGYDYDAIQKKVNEILSSSTNNLVDKMNAWAKKMAAEKYHYVKWSESDSKTHTCPICNGRKYDDHYGWNCIGWSFAIWHHGGGINCNCNCHVIADAKRILDAKTDQAAYDEAVKRVGIKNIEVIRDNGKSIKNKLKGGDICWTMSGGKIQHTYYYMGNGKYSDSTSGRSDNIKADITASSTLLNNTVLAIRYKDAVSTTPTTTTTTTTTPTTTTTVKKSYSDALPSMKLVKTNAETIADAIRWAIWIAGDNSFHYGYTNSSKTINAHHNGCYWCGTNVTSGGRSKAGIVDYEKSYCCNPFVGAAWAHGGCVPKAMELCQKGTSWDFSKGQGYDTSSLFTKLGHPAKSSLKAGDVLCRDTHVALYVGSGKIAEAGSGDDNVRNSTKWNNSIRVTTLTDANYKNFSRVYRFNSSVNTSIALYPGEISERVKLLQKYLNWYFGSQVCTVDGYFGDGTRKYVKAFQTARKIAADGIVGPATIAEMGKVQK